MLVNGQWRHWIYSRRSCDGPSYSQSRPRPMTADVFCQIDEYIRDQEIDSDTSFIMNQILVSSASHSCLLSSSSMREFECYPSWLANDYSSLFIAELLGVRWTVFSIYLYLREAECFFAVTISKHAG
jgi:hypothetical protein